MQSFGGTDTVQLSGQFNIHEHQVNLVVAEEGNGLFPEGQRADHGVAQFGDHPLQVHGQDGVVFDYENGCFTHMLFSRCAAKKRK